MTTKPYLTPTEFAKKHGVSRMSVQRRIAAGELAAKRVTAPGGGFVYQIDAAARFVVKHAGRPEKTVGPGVQRRAALPAKIPQRTFGKFSR